jgi:hypothetical protein
MQQSFGPAAIEFLAPGVQARQIGGLFEELLTIG